MDSDRLKDYSRAFNAMKAARSVWMPLWEEVRELVRPNASDFNQYLLSGENRREKLFENFPNFALNVMASGLHGYLTNSATRWFSLTTRSSDRDKSPAVRAWLDETSDILYEYFLRAETGFNSQVHELYLDLGAFGTAVLMVEDGEEGLILKSIPIAEVYIAENAYGVVDCVYREFKMTIRQIRGYFENLPRDVIEARDDSQMKTIIHCVQPRKGKNRRDPRKYESIYFDENFRHVYRESGFRKFPFIVVRWSKTAGEVYGRSPAMEALQDIRVLNELSRSHLQAIQLTTTPPLLVDDDGVLGKIKLKPWALNYRHPGSRGLEPMVFNPRIDFCIDAMNRKMDTIGRFFYNDLFNMPNFGSRDRVTAQEIAETKDDRLRQLSPAIGRLESELLGPLIERSYEFLLERGEIKSVPYGLSDKKLRIYYESPAARSLANIRASNIQRFISELIPLSQVKPEIWDYVDIDEVIVFLAKASQVPASAIKTREIVEEVRAKRSEEETQRQQLGAGVQVSEALKNVASASSEMQGLGVF